MYWLSSDISVMLMPVKTIPEFLRHAFWVLSKTAIDARSRQSWLKTVEGDLHLLNFGLVTARRHTLRQIGMVATHEDGYIYLTYIPERERRVVKTSTLCRHFGAMAPTIHLQDDTRPAAAEAMKKWDSGRSLRGINLWRGLTPLQFCGSGGVTPGNLWKYRCKSVQLGAFLGHQVIKSGTENRRFSVPLLKVGRNLPSLPYRFRGPCTRHNSQIY